MTPWPTEVPVAVSLFGDDNSYGPREWCEQYYQNIVYLIGMRRTEAGIIQHGRYRTVRGRDAGVAKRSEIKETRITRVGTGYDKAKLECAMDKPA